MTTYSIPYWILFLFLPSILKGQINTQVSLSNQTRTSAKVGLNLNSLTKPSWQNQSFLDSVQALHSPIIRYPGGTTSQYWDWRNGQVWPLSYWQNGTLQNHQNLTYANAVPHRLEDFKLALDSLGAAPLFVLNVLSDSLPSQMEFLRHAQQLGFPIKWIELGNELYFLEQDFVNKFPLPSDYATAMLEWIDSIQAVFPTAKIAAIGSSENPITPNGNNSPPRVRDWNDAMLAILPTDIALTFHRYYGHGNNITGVDSIRTIATAFSDYQKEMNYTIDSLSMGRKAWWTEYNLRDNLTGNHMVATSWLHALFTSILHLQKLSNDKNEVIIMHQVTGKEPFGALNSYFINGDTLQNNLTPLGRAMSLLHIAQADASSATPLNFSTNPLQTWNTINFPSLIGWRFQGPNSDKLILLNCAHQSFQVDLSLVTNTPFYHQQISSTHLSYLDPSSSNLQSITTTTSNTFNSAPYSLSIIDLNPTILNTTPLIPQQRIANIFPNPIQEYVTINFSSSFSGQLQLIDNKGSCLLDLKVKQQEIHTLKLSELQSGIYFLLVNTDDGAQEIHKIIKT